MTRVPGGTIGVTWNSAASAAALSGSSYKGSVARSPDVWVRSCRTVIPAVPGPSNRRAAARGPAGPPEKGGGGARPGGGGGGRPHGDPRRSGPVELRDVVRHRRVEVELAALHQQHGRGRGRNNLGQRGEIVERALRRHRARGGGPREPPVALGEEDGVAAPHDERRSGVGAGADAAQNDRVKGGGVKPGVRRGERDCDLQQNDR